MKRESSPVPMDVDDSPKRVRKEKAGEEFRSVNASVVLAVPPVFANRLRSGVEEMLDTMIMRCVRVRFPQISPSPFLPFCSVLFPPCMCAAGTSLR
jgi:hypothetical protein